MALRSLIMGVLLTACSLGAGDAIPPTVTTLRTAPDAIIPTISRTTQPISSPDVAPRAPNPITDRCQATGAQHTEIQAEVGLDYDARTAEVLQRTRLYNRANDPLEQIVFYVEPNRYPNVFTLNALAADQTVSDYELTGRRLTITLEQPLEPGCPLEVELDFTLRVQSVARGIAGFAGYLGYSQRQLNLGHWLPTVATRQRGEWVTHDVFAVGEQFVGDVADWDVTLTLIDAPPRLIIAAPGEVTQVTPDIWRIVHRDARDLAVSVSPFFQVQTRVTDFGATVELYHFDNATVETPQGRVDGAALALEAAAEALEIFSGLFGQYGDDRFVVVQGDFPDGMEFSGLVFVSDTWFTSFTGTPQSYLYIITVHEVAHQWWYARVGSDQALTPWLDEALATYSEYIYYEEVYPDLKDWWWAFRVASFVPSDFTGRPVDSSIYHFANVRDYINAVYLRGARMLHRLRDELGTQEFFDWLRRYADAGAGGIVASDRLWALLTTEQLEATDAIRRAYLGSP